MKERKKTQLKRMDNLLNLSTKIKLSAENLKLLSKGYGDEVVCERKIKEITEDSKQLLSLLNVISHVEKNGEDQNYILSC